MDTPKLPTGYTQADFDLLTDEEKAGLLEQAEQEAADRNGDDDAGGEDGGAGEDEPKPADPPADKGADPADKTQDPPPAPAVDPKPANPTPAEPAPAAPVAGQPAHSAASVIPKWTAPADVDKQIDDLKASRRDLRQKYEDGDLTGAEYDAQLEQIDDKLDGLKASKMKASISSETRQHTWFNTHVSGFIADHAEYAPNSIRMDALDKKVRILQVEAQEKGQDDLDPEILKRAHDLVEAELGPAPGARKPAPKVDSKDPKRPDPPPTLGGLPSADPEDTTDGGEFAYLERLTGQDFEDAMAKLSDAKREQYLAGL